MAVLEINIFKLENILLLFPLQKQIFNQANELEKYKIKDTVGLSDFIDKNSRKLAIAKLEKVKEKVENRNRGTRQGHSSVEYKDGYSGCCCEITDFINNQIKQLKEQKND